MNLSHTNYFNACMNPYVPLRIGVGGWRSVALAVTWGTGMLPASKSSNSLREKERKGERVSVSERKRGREKEGRE